MGEIIGLFIALAIFAVIFYLLYLDQAKTNEQYRKTLRSMENSLLSISQFLETHY